MLQETLNKIKNTVETKNFGYSLDSMNAYMESTGKKAIQFIEKLVAAGVPLSQINTTDWSAAPIKVFVEVPYGSVKGHQNKFLNSFKTYVRFSEHDFNNALGFWKENSGKSNEMAHGGSTEPKLNYYQQLIVEACGCPAADAAEVENYMRDIIFHSTLSWQTKEQLAEAAKQAWGDIEYMRSPEGKKYLAEVEKEMGMKQGGTVNLGFGSLGNGTTVWDRNREEHGDYKKVAHISETGEIKYYDKNLPDYAIKEIEELAGIKYQIRVIINGKSSYENFSNYKEYNKRLSELKAKKMDFEIKAGVPPHYDDDDDLTISQYEKDLIKKIKPGRVYTLEEAEEEAKKYDKYKEMMAGRYRIRIKKDGKLEFEDFANYDSAKMRYDKLVIENDYLDYDGIYAYDANNGSNLIELYKIIEMKQGGRINGSISRYLRVQRNEYGEDIEIYNDLEKKIVALSAEPEKNKKKIDFYKEVQEELKRKNAHTSNFVINNKMKQGGTLKKSQIDEVLKHYIIAALWAETNMDNDQPFDRDYTEADIAPATMKTMREKVKKFLFENKDAIEQSGLADSQIGHSLWLTQNRHGAGFFDFTLPDGVEEKLTAGVHALGEGYVEAGDDGKIYVRYSGAKMKQGGIAENKIIARPLAGGQYGKFWKSKTVFTKDGVEVEKGTQKYKGHIFYDEEGTGYKCMGYFPKIDDCIYINLKTKKQVVGCMDGFYFNKPKKQSQIKNITLNGVVFTPGSTGGDMMAYIHTRKDGSNIIITDEGVLPRKGGKCSVGFYDKNDEPIGFINDVSFNLLLENKLPITI